MGFGLGSGQVYLNLIKTLLEIFNRNSFKIGLTRSTFPSCNSRLFHVLPDNWNNKNLNILGVKQFISSRKLVHLAVRRSGTIENQVLPGQL